MSDPLPAAVTHLCYPRERIFHLRALRGMSCSALAEASGLTTREVERIENSPPSEITVLQILRLAQGLDAHPAWLAYGVGDVGSYPFDPRAAWPDPMPVPTSAPPHLAEYAALMRQCEFDVCARRDEFPEQRCIAALSRELRRLRGGGEGRLATDAENPARP